MPIKVEETTPKTRLSLYESALYGAFNALTVATKVEGEELNLADRKILPKYIYIPDGTHTGDITLPDPAAHEAEAVFVLNDDANENIEFWPGFHCPFGTLSLVYSDGTNWIKLFSVLTV